MDQSKITTMRDQRESKSQSIDWYGEGQSRTVEVDGTEVTVRYIARKGRRARICITAPTGAVFRALGATPREHVGVRT